MKYQININKNNEQFDWNKFVEDWKKDGGVYRIVIDKSNTFLCLKTNFVRAFDKADNLTILGKALNVSAWAKDIGEGSLQSRSSHRMSAELHVGSSYLNLDVFVVVIKKGNINKIIAEIEAAKKYLNYYSRKITVIGDTIKETKNDK